MGKANYRFALFGLKQMAFMFACVSAASQMASGGVVAHIGDDSIVRVSAEDGYAEQAKLRFDFPVSSKRKVLARTAEAIDWLETSVPHRWLTADGIRKYTW